MDMGYHPFEIEAHWRRAWEESGVYRAPDITRDPAAEKFYCLDFFPYPSGEGLTVGHARNYVPTDVMARFMRMCGRAVLHPMGWDAFGLPAENEAIKKGTHPRESTRRYAANYRRQMTLMGKSIDWEREINSSDPEYYRWTQWFFLLLFKRGLAYRAETEVNWCETDQTVLANEEIENGCCWRCHNPVTTRKLNQWFFRITAYADRLLNDLALLDWPEHIVRLQQNWIGRSRGAEVVFRAGETAIPVFTTRPDTLWGATFLVLSPQHELAEKIAMEERGLAVAAFVEQARQRASDPATGERDKTGVFTGRYAINPVDGRAIPIWIADYVLTGYGTGAIMAVPAHDPRDFDFARRYGLPIRPVIQPDGVPIERVAETAAWEGEGRLVDSGPFTGDIASASMEAIITWLEEKGWATAQVRYRMRDWLISRQRYWGAPIPIVHCSTCGPVPVPEEQLPVLLPELADYRPRGEGRSPLANVAEFVHTTCPQCGGSARRETDTMGGFACSSWYFLRFANPHYSEFAFDPQAVRRWLPVDLYIGGAEHAVAHLLYARFWTKVMADAGLIDFSEPFPRLRSQGVLHAADGKRMAKSRPEGVVNPDAIIDQYGADAFRLHILFMAPFEAPVTWTEEGLAGMRRFLRRVWDLAMNREERPQGIPRPDAKAEDRLVRAMHRAIQKVTSDVEAFRLNTAVSELMIYVNALEDHRTAVGATPAFTAAVDSLVRLLAPFAPYVAEEIWHRWGRPGSIHHAAWPVFDPEMTRPPEITLIVQVNGKVRDRVQVHADVTEAQAREVALAAPGARRALDGQVPRQIIFVPGRIVNIVTR